MNGYCHYDSPVPVSLANLSFLLLLIFSRFSAANARRNTTIEQTASLIAYTHTTNRTRITSLDSGQVYVSHSLFILDMVPGLTPFALVLSFYILSVGWLYKASTQLTTSLPPGRYPTDQKILIDLQIKRAPIRIPAKLKHQPWSSVIVARVGTAVKGPTPSRCHGVYVILGQITGS